MGIAQGFLAGQQVKNQAEAQKMGLLSALINRPVKKGGAIRHGGGSSGGGDGGWDRSPGLEQDKNLRATGREIADPKEEEVYGAAMEQKGLETDILRQALTEKETAAANAAKDRAKAEREDVSAGQIREGARQDTLDYQEQMRHYKAYSAAIYRGDAAAADRHFRGIYPGMDGDTRPATVKRQQRDEKGELRWKDEAKEIPLMQETPEYYGAEGKKMTEAAVQEQQASYPKHRSDGGVVSLQFGGEEPVPIGPKRLRQMLMSIHPSMMQQGSGQAGAAGTGQAGGGVKTEKMTAEIAYKKMQTGSTLYKAAKEIADSKPMPTKEGETPDPMAVKSAQDWQKDFDKALVDIYNFSNAGTGGKSGNQTLAAITPLEGASAKRAAKKAYDLVHKMRKDGFDPQLDQIEQRLQSEYGVATVYNFNKLFKAERTPPDYHFTYKEPTATPDFGNGKENVLHINDNKNKFGFAIDKTLGRPMYLDRYKKAWVPMNEDAVKAFTNILNEKADGGDKKAEKILQLLNSGPENTENANQDLRAKSDIAGTMREGDKTADEMTQKEIEAAMKDRTSPASRFLEQARNLPQEERERRLEERKRRDKETFLGANPYSAVSNPGPDLRPKSDIALTREYYRRS